MPVLKAFLFEPGGADAYLDLDVRIVRGKDPELVMGERRLSLSGYTTPEALHGLLAEHSFTRADDGLRNHHWQCYHWRDKGECARNPEYMRAHCARACSLLRDSHARCAAWATVGESAHNAVYMLAECPVACQTAAAKSEL